MSAHFRSLIAFMAIAIFAQGAFAHTYLSAVYLNDKLLAEGDCMRAHPKTGYDSPISSVLSPDMSCGFLPAAQSPANRMCPISAGSKIGLQWHHSSNSPTDDIVDPSHLGPIIFYLGKLNTDLGKVQWFKIYEDGYSNGQWAVNRLLANKGRVDVTIPADIAAGNYLLRGELIALHGANALNGVQPYVGCVELAISGGGSANPAGVLIPGAYKNTDPGMLFSLYNGFTSYVIPGPALYKAGAVVGSPNTVAPTSAPTTTPKPVATNPPTSTPTSTPKPVATKPPTVAPTTKPVAGGIQVQLYPGTNGYWVGVTVLGGSETTVKVEVMDSGSLSNFVALSDQSYAFVFGSGKALVLPLTLRITSSSGKQIVLNKIFASFSSSALVNTGVNYGSSVSTPAPTKAASTPAPSTSVPAAGNAKFTVHQGANPWWFALMVDGVSGATVEIMDSSMSAFEPMNNEGWAYTFTTGAQLVAPVTIRISANGNSVTSTLETISPSQVVSALAL